MAVIYTKKIIDGITYDYAYSDSDRMIERDGAYYSEAVDPLNSNRVYTETDMPIEAEETDDSEQSSFSGPPENDIEMQ